jgi:hypothetical protein
VTPREELLYAMYNHVTVSVLIPTFLTWWYIRAPCFHFDFCFHILCLTTPHRKGTRYIGNYAEAFVYDERLRRMVITQYRVLNITS